MIAAKHRFRKPVLIALALAGTALSAPAAGQTDAEVRIKKLEAEVRALQRKVFPGTDGKYFEAEIARPATAANAVPAGPASSPVNDLAGRIDALEGALARLTAQSEESANRTAKLETRLAVIEANAGATPAGITPVPVTARPAASPSIDANTAAMTGTSAPPRAGSERLTLVSAVEKPVSADKGEDDYLYGYRLWESKFYPEAAAQLKQTVDKYPRHKRISYARNLMGRAYLDDGKPGMAAQAFLANYQADKAGDRAPDSLLYLAVAMTRLKETKRACVALAEFAEVYPQEAAGRLATQYGSAQKAVKCN